MIRHLIAAALALLVLAAGAAARAGTMPIPPDMTLPSAVGEVLFRHEAHVKERGIACVACHHQIDAKKLKTPHPDYMQSSWINCTVCHDGAGKVKTPVYGCSACHGTNPRNIADETLSAKVVIHRQCWKCHSVGTGKDASAGCQLCHSGKKTP
jgi:hypothetical protein